MSKIKYNDQFSYELFDDGYDIYEYDVLIITQHDPYGKPYDHKKSYEENCLTQLAYLSAEEHPPKPTDDPIAVNAANIDYIAMMTGIDLPNWEEGEEDEDALTEV